jgi:hypothetical protein
LGTFNKVFEENRLEDVHKDHGYGDWMKKSSSNREDQTIVNVVGEYSHDKFHKTFDTRVALNKHQTALIRRKTEPVAVYTQGNQQCEELGLTRISDFGDRLATRGISYADYKRAHSVNRLVDPQQLEAAEARSQTTSVDNALRRLEVERDRVSFVMNDRDKRRYEKQRLMKEQHEQHRLEQVKRRDRVIEQNFNRMQRLLLGSSR